MLEDVFTTVAASLDILRFSRPLNKVKLYAEFEGVLEPYIQTSIHPRWAKDALVRLTEARSPLGVEDVRAVGSTMAWVVGTVREEAKGYWTVYDYRESVEKRIMQI